MAKKRVAQAAPQVEAPERTEAFIVRYSLVIFLALVAIASTRIILYVQPGNMFEELTGGMLPAFANNSFRVSFRIPIRKSSC